MLEALLKAMNTAKAKAEANPTDKALQTEYATAKAAYDEAKAAADAREADDETPGENDEGEDGEEGEPDESKLDAQTKKYIAKLRKESASHRTKNKDLASAVKAEKEKVTAILKAAGIESEDEKPEVKVKSLTGENSTLAFSNAVLRTAVEHGIPADQLDYFEFMISKATSLLEEGEELPEEKLLELVAKVKKQGTKGSANSTVGKGNGDKGDPAPSGNTDEISLDKFCSMSITEKSKLYEKNPGKYAELLAMAKAKKKLV